MKKKKNIYKKITNTNFGQKSLTKSRATASFINVIISLLLIIELAGR